MGQRQAVLDHLDEVVCEAALLPADERVQVLDVAVSRLQAAEATALAELEATGTLAGSGCKSPGSWVRLHLRRGVSGFRITRRAAMLPALAGFAAAFAAGEVTDEHVDTLIRWVKPCGLEVIQTHEATLLGLARRASAKELDTALEALADLARPDRDADRIAALADRSIKISALGDLVHVDAMVEPTLGEALKTAVEAGGRRPVGVSRGDDGRTLTQRRADAFGEIVLAGIATHTTAGTGSSTAGTGERATGNAGTGSGGTGSGATTTGRLRAQVAVTVTLDELAGIDGAPKALLAHFGAIPTDTVRRLVCDGDLTRVILDVATGKPLSVGRRHRLAVTRQRRALAVIFRHCVFPGCQVPFRFCEIHHRDWWCRDHGGTDLDVLLPYCWTHHHYLHEYGFTVTTHTTEDTTNGTTNGTTRLVHRRPDGHQIPDPDHPLRHAVTQLRLDHATDTAAEPRHPPDESRHPPSAAA